MEVKNWQSPTIPLEHRMAKQEEFEQEMGNDSFWNKIVSKFEGTHFCLLSRGERPEGPVLLLLLECDPYSRGQLAPDISILQRKVAASSYVSDGTVAILPFGQLSSYVHGCFADPCTSSSQSAFECADPVDHCSQARQRHLKQTQKR
jgi:hypothetical protein